MVVTSIVITTILVFILVDFLLRLLLGRVRATRIMREREQALDIGLKLDVSDEAPTLIRVDLEKPLAKILAVDDEEIVLDSLRKMLALAGYSIDTVESGSEALGLISSRDYDFVFTDLKMPGMDGIEVTKAVKHLRPDIDVVIITGYGTIESAVETVQFGAMDYIEKPFTEDELLGFARTALIKRQDRLAREARHKIRLVTPGTGESKSRFELNVPAGAFISPQHAWARIELNGAVRVGLDELIRKIFRQVDAIELPRPDQNIQRGETLFTLRYGGYTLDIPSPVSGQVISVNSEHADHPEWLAIKPFELSWICRIEPANLAAELPDLKIGHDAVDWYQAELDRYSQLAANGGRSLYTDEPDKREGSTGSSATETLRILERFAEPFR